MGRTAIRRLQNPRPDARVTRDIAPKSDGPVTGCPRAQRYSSEMSSLACSRSHSATRNAGPKKAIALGVAAIMSILMAGCSSVSVASTTAKAKLPVA